MLQTIKFCLLRLMRERSNLFWILLFPILLGTMFKVAFANIDASESKTVIPVAVVKEDTATAEQFCKIIDALAEEGDDRMLSVTYCAKDEALKLLEDKEITGIFYAGDDITLSISANMSNANIYQSILQTFLEQYQLRSAIFTEAAIKHPDPELIAAMEETLTKETSYGKEVTLGLGRSDTYTQYFYNLIAMACLFTAIGGLYISIENQGNLSTLAARKNVSPRHKLVSMVGELIAYVLFEFLLNLIAFVFMILVLKIDLTARLPLAILTIFLSVATGVTLGFFIGAFGRFSESFKTGLVFIVVMPCCFLSGLMVGNMRAVIDRHAPVINRLNPAALIADSFYSISNYETLNRYYINIITLVIYMALFTIGAFLLTRRKKYASL